MKRKIGIVTVIVLTIALFPACYDDENDFIVAVHDKTIEITGYRGTKTDINIPPRIQKMPVTAIGKRAFAEKKLTGVKIPKGVTVIDNFAFYENHLIKIIIPDTVVSIGDAAFAYNELTSVKIPDTVTGIGAAVFAYNKITKIVFPAGITVISSDMFKNNELTGITIPESVATIGVSAFKNNKLTEIVFPESVISIGQGAFDHSWDEKYNWNIIKRVTIGDNVDLSEDLIYRFGYFYNEAVRKKGGTYIYSGDNFWIPEDKNITVYKFFTYYDWKSPDIKFLADMPDLEMVSLLNNELLTDITPLSELTKIRNLRIEHCENIKSLKPLSSMVNLEYLYLTENYNYDYSDLAPLRNLELAIYLHSTNETSLNSIGQLPYLKSLIIYGDGNTIRNINELRNLTSLEMLYIQDVDKNNDTMDTSWIANLHNLKSLHLNRLKRTTYKNINELKSMTKLETLYIYGADNFDLSWMANLHNLIKLELDMCTVKDLSPLADLPNLAEVKFKYNRIDITPLLRSNSIKHVRVFDDDYEADIDDHTISLFDRKGIELRINHEDDYYGK